MARTMAKDERAMDANFTANVEQLGIKVTPRELVETCLHENDQRMAGYDERLPRPAVVPLVAGLALKALTAGENLRLRWRSRTAATRPSAA